uniref:Ig-like domain-containing protein n=1 Tax=Pelusios castaneus TaxID=367368 RepID=A0A8C8SGY2_9SAUR
LWGDGLQCICTHVVSCFFPGVGSTNVEQLPFFTGVPGESRTLQCMLKNAEYYHMYWYRQKGGRKLEGLFYSGMNGPGNNFTAEPMTALRMNRSWQLTWNSLSQSDSAMYYCACSTAHLGGLNLLHIYTGLSLSQLKLLLKSK